MSKSEESVASEAVRRVLELGVREFCVCSGARNLALVRVLASLGEGVRSYHLPEERCAAFFAVGRMQVSGRPMAVVTTSGTAVAELLPAMVEAHYQGLPLVALTADRPARFRGTGAPQAIEQPGIFSHYARGSVDFPDGAGELRDWDGRGPLHVNVPLEEEEEGGTLAPEDPVAASPGSPPSPSPLPAIDRPLLEEFLARKSRMLVLVGALRESERDAVSDFLVRLAVPVWAEASSGLREDPALKPFLLRGWEGDWSTFEWRKVLRIGGLPSLRFWRDLDDRSAVEVLSVSFAGFSGLARPTAGVTGDAGLVLRGLDPGPGTFCEGIMALDEASAAKLNELCETHPRSEPALVRRLSKRMPRGARVFLGNSLPIREWNLCADGERAFGGGIYANRGANGIDGELSSFLGCSAGVEEAWGIFGDLTALYDLASPWILPQLDPGRRRFVIINNGGGRIFSRLPAVRAEDAQTRRLIENPHELSFEAWATLWGMRYARVDGKAGGLEEAVDELGGHEGAAVLEVRPDAAETEAFWEGLGV